MQTNFSAEQLADGHTRALEKILRSCVHCGFCTATCPTYVVSGDERDSPRGRIYLIKDLLEKNRAATADDVWPIDHCLSCLACATTCPSGVDYRRLIDHARVHVEKTFRRPLVDRALRAALVRIVPSRRLFRLSLAAATLGRPFAGVLKRLPKVGASLDAMLKLAPRRTPARDATEGPGTFAAVGARRGRVALLVGCVQSVVRPQINAATIRLLTRVGYDVVLARGEKCCGSLAHHMGHEKRAFAQARKTIDAWIAEADSAGLDAIVVSASGCGSTIKDYGAMLADDPAYADKTKRIAALARDVSEFLLTLELPFLRKSAAVLAYQSPCSLQHGQKIGEAPRTLLRRAAFTVRDIPESHLCCGSAGVYNILEPAISNALVARKVAAIGRVKADAIATANVGCLVQIALQTATPIAHAVEFVDWACGGPAPDGVPSALLSG